jgi:serine/threonine protein kinase
MPDQHSATLAVGELLEGKYQIARELGRGAMGVVYEAMHTALGRRVAVKTLIEGAGADVEMGARFEREARAASAIGHPHIIDVFDLGRTKQGLLFMVMELLDGVPLATMLQQTPQLPIPLAIDLMSQVLGGLAAAHKHGIVHRDLKPENIFVINTEERPNFVKIVDFGISKVLGPQAATAGASVKFAGTMVGAVLGTPLYMSPEQAIGQVAVIDHRTDIYSAGVVLYQMLCGRTPFTGTSYPQILGGILEGKFPLPRSLRPEIPATLEAAIVRALARDIEARFATAADMRAELVGAQTATGQAAAAFSSSIGGPLPIAPASSTGDPLPVSLAPADKPFAVGDEPIALLDHSPLSPAAKKRAASPGADPFAPPPDSTIAPLLANPLDRSVSFHPSPAMRRAPEPERFESPPPRARPATPPRERPIAAPRRDVAPARERDIAPVPEPLRPPKKRPWLLIAIALLVLAVGVRFGLPALRSAGQGGLSPKRGDRHKLLLAVEPREASVQIDHIPVTAGAFPLDSGPQRPHVLNATAPGRVTRRFSFTMTSDTKLGVRLSHTLGAPSPTDPPPLPAELAADYPDSPRPAAEIDSAFAKLDRFAECLAVASDPAADDRRGGAHGRLGSEDLALCQRLVNEASSTEPALPELQAAAEGYLAAVRKGQKPEALAGLATTFRAEFLAARTAWQMEELSRQGKDEGQNAAWHMRRVALAAQAWLRARKASPSDTQAGETQRARLQEYFQTFTNHIRSTPQALANTHGGSDFLSAAEELLALANGQGGRKPSEFAALDACRKLLAAFDALVVE